MVIVVANWKIADDRRVECHLRPYSDSRSTKQPLRIQKMGVMTSRLFNRRGRGLGLTRTQWQVLQQLHEKDGQTQTDLADALFMARPPLGKVIDRLEADAWLVRRDDPVDRRAKRVYLTDKVRPLIGPLENIVSDIGEIAMTGMSAQDRRQFNDLMHRAHANLSTAITNE
jgi:MarR family transcriptional regulator for hemolysin